ncbi:heme peroxidase [Crassisporium funariophilum]|nr:heme peroxidase [Crassisporium funariophilum]
MSTLIRRFSQRIDYFKETRAPLHTEGGRPQTGTVEKRVMEIQDLVENPAITLKDLPAFWDALKNMNGVGLDDRKLLANISKKVQQAVINLLYKDLPHPPSGYLCHLPLASNVNVASPSKVKYAFRLANGSCNNPLFPTLGQAGSPYARSVPSTNISPKSALPDPGLVFDTLLKRDEFAKHPGGISALFFAFADLVIHSIFNTNPHDWTINDASSYLDLSVLYGSSDSQVESVRRQDGSGKLHDDVFADGRLLMMPPASCALLILMNRNHNYIAQRILDINENKNLKFPLPTDKDENKIQDDEIFHRARLVNCGYFMHIILGDYVGAILGLVRDGCDWRLDPLMTMREIDHEFAPTGEGNVVSVEFNLLYRWHSTLSEQDTKWTTDKFKQLFPGKDLNDASSLTVSIQDFKDVAHTHFIPPKDPRVWTFNELKRDGGGRFKDSDLANILHNATEWRAGAFQARGVPEALRVIEIMGIKQSRSWGTCSLNEFRKFLGLKPYANFQEWNPDPTIHLPAAALYKDIDNLELHVGLQAEEAKKPGPGAGLCPGYTISRAILADAVCLTRGDRFMTTEFTPFNLTAWGYQDCQYDSQDGSYGGMLTKLLFRTLPDHYPRGSAYAHFPFLDPVYMEDHLKTQNPGLAEKYTWKRPRALASTIPLDSFTDVTQVLTEPQNFMSAYGSRLFTTGQPFLTKKVDTSKSEDKKQKALSKATTALTSGTAELSKLIFSKPNEDTISYFAKETQALIKSKSFDHVGKPIKYVDIVKDVINLVPIHWISQEIAGLPLKTETNPHGAWYEQTTYEKFAEVAQYIYLNFDPVNDWRLREAAQEHCSEISEIIKDHLGGFDFISDAQNHIGIENNNGHTFLRNLYKASGKKGTREFASQVFAAVVPTAALYSQAVAHVVNYYLEENNKEAREDIVSLVNSTDKDAASKVVAYIHEALRLDPPIAGVYRTAAKDIPVEEVTVQATQQVFASITNANLDVSVFGPNAATANYSRPSKNSGIMALGEHGLLTSKFFEATVPAILGSILSMKGLRRGPGQSGSFTRFKEECLGTQVTQYISLQGLVTPWPDSLIVQYTN